MEPSATSHHEGLLSIWIQIFSYNPFLRLDLWHQLILTLCCCPLCFGCVQHFGGLCLIWMCFTIKFGLYRNNGIIHSRGSHFQTKTAYPSAPLDGKIMSFFMAHFLHYKLVILHNRMWIILLPGGLIFSFLPETTRGHSWGVILTAEDGADRQRSRSRT